MRRVPYALGMLAALVLATAPAQAAGCPLLPDPVGDVGPGGIALPVSLSNSLDIVGVDVASGATTVVAVLRVRSLALEPTSFQFPRWSAGWRVDGGFYGVSAAVNPSASGVVWESTFTAHFGAAVPVPVVVDRAAGTFTWTLPRSTFSELATPGATFDGIHAQARELLTFTADYAGTPSATTPSFVDGDPGCVPAA